MFTSALILRLIVALCVFHSVAAPTLDHNEFGWEMGWTARSITLGHGFGSPFLPWTGPTAIVPPIYPYLLALIFRIFGLYTAKSALVVLSLNSIFSALTCLPIYFIADHSLGRRAARLAGWAWVVYPFAIYFSAGIVWDYALTGLLFCTCFWMAQRLHLHADITQWVAFGALFGITALSNPSIVVTLPFLLLIAVVKVRQVDGRWLRNGLVTALTFAAVLTPWTIRNYRSMHALFPVRDGFWLEFYAGNNGDTFESNSAWAHPASNPVEMQKYQTMGEMAYFAEKRTIALNFVKHHPLFFVEVTARRALRFWTGFWSFNRDYLRKEFFDIPNLFFCTALTLLMLRGIKRWWRVDRTTTLRYLILLTFFPLAYYFTHSSMDYRQPIEPEIVILVTVGLFGLDEAEEFPEGSLEAVSKPEMVGA
jgi:4-amino-4-deoxy-L-arabinose transferase-like glycosyltransferase